jgi:hypothetical protein
MLQARPCLRAVALLTTLALIALAPAEAHALDGPSPTAWVTDGSVNTIVPDASGRMYVGGDFHSWGPRLGHGVRLTPDSNAATALPDINGSVLASVADDAGGEFIGGNFTTVGGQDRSRLAHIRADGSLDPDWNPGAPATVRALALSGADLFVGGDFVGKVGGANHWGIAKLSAATGSADPTWTTLAKGSVATLVVAGGNLYAGGAFLDLETTNTTSGPRLARVSTSGAGDADQTWAPAPDGPAKSLVVSGADVYVGGGFNSIGGQTRFGLAKLGTGGTGTADATWDPHASGPVNALALSGSDLFAGGAFATVGGQTRHNIAKLATTGTGAADASWNADIAGTVNSVVLSGSQLLIGGKYFGINQTLRSNLASISTSGTGTVSSWDPRPNGGVDTITPSAGHLFAGGDLTSAGTSVAMTGPLVRLNADGTLDTSWSPQLGAGTVSAIAADDANVYVGGDFFLAGPVGGNLAKIAVGGNGSPDASWAPRPQGAVNALALSGGDLFVGGAFAAPNLIGGQERNALAKLATSGAGAADATWNPDPKMGPEVDALALSGSDLFVGGGFAQISGATHVFAAKVSTTGAGAADPDWQPNFSNVPKAFVVSGSSLFAGGNFDHVGGVFRRHIAKVAAAGTGAVDSWNPGTDGDVTAIALSGDQLYAAGDFGRTGGPFTTFPETDANHLARFSVSTAALDTTFGLPASTNGGGASALATTQNSFLVGGSFDSVGELSTSHFALFDLQAPTVDVTVPSEGARYRQGEVVNSAFACVDLSGTPGLACAGPVAAGGPIDTGSPGAKSFTVIATDAGGNVVSKTVNYSVDGSAPAIALTQPADGASYVVGSKVAAVYSCTDPDGAADVVSCVGSVPAGVQVDTSSAGNRTFTVSSADAVGNTETKVVNYSITKPTVRPIISALKITPGAFRAAPKGATTSARKKPPVGAKVSYRLSLVATVSFKVTRKSGRKTITVGTFKLKGKQGANKFTFRGRLKKKKLKPGNYRLIAQATGATGLRSVTVARSFRIAKG